jgi:mevalonate kinase
MIKASAPGKIILFGEHAVVYGEAAIATAINKRANVTLCKMDDKIVVSFKREGDENDVEAPVGAKISNPFIKTAQYCLEKLKVEGGVGIEVDSKIPMQAGLGSSAAICSAIATAVYQRFADGEEIDFAKVNQAAFEGEKVAHGNPSGIDNTVTTFGGSIHYKRGVVEPLEFEPFELVVGNTGQQGNTKEMVARIKTMIEDPKMATHLFKISSIVWGAKTALKHRNFFEIGRLMDKNHECLRGLGVSTQGLEEMIKAAKKAGALGAKITGGGGGGCMIALAEEGKTDHVLEAIREAGAKSAFKVKINQQGAKVE